MDAGAEELVTRAASVITSRGGEPGYICQSRSDDRSEAKRKCNTEPQRSWSNWKTTESKWQRIRKMDWQQENGCVLGARLSSNRPDAIGRQ